MIPNGLYLAETTFLDGVDAYNRHVMVLRDGTMRGGGEVADECAVLSLRSPLGQDGRRSRWAASNHDSEWNLSS